MLSMIKQITGSNDVFVDKLMLSIHVEHLSKVDFPGESVQIKATASETSNNKKKKTSS